MIKKLMETKDKRVLRSHKTVLPSPKVIPATSSFANLSNVESGKTDDSDNSSKKRSYDDLLKVSRVNN